MGAQSARRANRSDIGHLSCEGCSKIGLELVISAQQTNCSRGAEIRRYGSRGHRMQTKKNGVQLFPQTKGHLPPLEVRYSNTAAGFGWRPSFCPKPFCPTSCITAECSCKNTCRINLTGLGQ